jgi:hypothetical protein
LPASLKGAHRHVPLLRDLLQLCSLSPLGFSQCLFLLRVMVKVYLLLLTHVRLPRGPFCKFTMPSGTRRSHGGVF